MGKDAVYDSRYHDNVKIFRFPEIQRDFSYGLQIVYARDFGNIGIYGTGSSISRQTVFFLSLPYNFERIFPQMRQTANL